MMIKLILSVIIVLKLTNAQDALFLTPLLQDPSKNLADIQNSAKIEHASFAGITAYSGFFTVDTNFNSNMFFVYVEAASDATDVPVVLWMNGGPGISSLQGLFYENGPFIMENGRLKPWNNSWHTKAHMLYIDNPVGTGFSFTTSASGYSTNQTGVGNNLYSALDQFFTLFPDLKSRDFYITGQSYVGKYAPTLGALIHEKNKRAKSKINFKGVMIGNGWVDPINQMDYGEFYFQIGLIDSQARKIFESHVWAVKAYIISKQFLKAIQRFQIGTAFILSTTGLPFYLNYVHPENIRIDLELAAFVTQPEMRKALHVGNFQFGATEIVAKFLALDYMDSVATALKTLYTNNYRILIYTGHLDMSITYTSTLNYLCKLITSADRKIYKKAARQVWKVETDVAGYAKTVKNVTEVLVRNAGHLTLRDQPKWIFDLFGRFIENKGFS